MITDRTLARLRTSASLALLVPGLSVTVSVEGRTVVEATRTPFVHGAHPMLPVCAFHRSVVRAHDLRQSGSRIEMVGVVGDLEPEIELHPSGPVRIVPGGVVRFDGDGCLLHLCALSLPVERVEAFARQVAADVGLPIDVHADRSLDVTVAVTDTPPGDVDLARRAVDALERLASIATVDALVELLEPTEDWESLLR